MLRCSAVLMPIKGLILMMAQTDVKMPATVQGGTSVVDQEIQRQREREAQLRAERELLATACLASPSSSPAVTPLTSAGGSSARRPAELVDAERLNKRRTFEGESSLVHEMDQQRRREEELRQQRSPSSDVNGHSDSRVPASHVDSQVRGADRRPTRVRPFGDEYDNDEEGAASARLSFITPRNDTLIEREIRITRQREGSLRRVRGYPAVNQQTAVDDQQTAVEVSLSGFGRRLQAPLSPPASTSPRRDDNRDGSAVDDNVAMKRMATNRLRQEILRERKREVDLRNQGKIFTISEEHIERPPLLEELVAASANASPRDVGATRVDDIEQKDSGVVDVVDSDGRRLSSVPAAHRHPQQQQQQQQPAQYNRLQNDTGRRRLVGEKLIEQEVRELRRREQELRSDDRIHVSFPLFNI